ECRRVARSGAPPPNPRSLAPWRPTPGRGRSKRAGTRIRSPRPLAYRRPPGARVAPPQSPILATARPTAALADLAASPHLDCLRSLRIEGGDQTLRPLVASPHLGRLTELQVDVPVSA